ncbi:hypothetical protein OIO07_20570 [Bacillus paralicheniformis]|jgi:hypothetical protein|uniref:hypothetical protein n=1 Tax=Bacillus paralicheniformis TaxID=1648923 RepID=UPI0008286CAC|nr:hypothetical protein [Bacillus paralicheniformis]AYQ17715.1 hypothetical protein D5285_17455 [Bacillus paralicheniformis]MCV9370624.1 hypothetical protein [Bacillus paralicheniformis]MDI0243689.1 hypothetical protein [Bacillus paralicheniformis]MEC2328838.1 hypothetical protein [Bacillus paralicheniformis]MED0700366.1 hypothetical protein [Bacillus paralicheniformis]
MAKLHGVKTLDKVNGEITKVAYDGAEYERVEGTPRSVGKSGDLVLNGHRHPDLKLGGFYLLVRDEGTSLLSVRDEIDDFHGNAVTDGDSILFRKVAASQSSLEDRISTNEKDIESLKSDVAALKVEAVPKYVRIDKSEAKAGDFVKFPNATSSYLTSDKYYEIYRVDGCGDPQIYDDDGDSYDTCGKRFEVYRKVSAAEPKPERLKVGDYAKVVGTARNGYCGRGDIVKITEDDDSAVPFKLAFVNGEYAGWEDEKSLVRAADEEVAEAKRKQAEVKECKRWAAIGREVSEYRIGDIVGYDDRTAFETNGFGEVVSESGGGTLRIEAVDNFGDVERYNVDPDELNLIVPVEARFDRK